jgi:cytochrome o ubiquinol oxidase subunit 2
MSDMSAIDAKGGLGLAAANNILPLALEYDKNARRGAVFGDEPSYVARLCTIDEPAGMGVEGPLVAPPDTSRLTGAGLPPPPFTALRFSPVSFPGAARRLSNS